MRVQSPRILLLALVLVFGQWLSFAHANNHPAVAHEHLSCEFCVHSQGLLPGLSEMPEQPALSYIHESPEPQATYFLAVEAPSYCAIRGPPVFTA